MKYKTEYGRYWSRSYNGTLGWRLGFDAASGAVVEGNTYRYSGLTIRPLVYILVCITLRDAGNNAIAGETINVGGTMFRTNSDGVAAFGITRGEYSVSCAGYTLSVQEITVTDDMELVVTATDPRFIDLGLPSGLKWANGNIVSDGNGGYEVGSETDYGAYVSWGNVAPHFCSGGNGRRFNDNYNWGDDNNGAYASTPGAGISFTSAHKNADFAPESGYDAARELLGGNWRMPTATEFKELYDNCTSAWVTKNGVNGREFTSKRNGAKLFLPAAGEGSGTTLGNRTYSGRYQTSSLGTSRSGYWFYFNSSTITPQAYSATYDYRYIGYTVRAVR